MLGKKGEGIKKPEELLIHTETVGLESLHTQVAAASSCIGCTHALAHARNFNPLHQDMSIHAVESQRCPRILDLHISNQPPVTHAADYRFIDV